MSAGGEKLFIAGAHNFHQVRTGNQRLMLAHQMRPLCGPSDDLFRNVLHVGEGFAVAVRSNRGKALIVALHLAVGTGHERVVAELLIVAECAFAHSRVVGLDWRAVVAEFGIETSAGKDATFASDLMADGQFQRGIFRVGGSVDAAALRSWNENKTVGPEQLGGEREVPLLDPDARQEREIGSLLIPV